MKKSGVYTITNLVNNKVYVGCSTDLVDRKSNHFRELRENRHGNKYLQSAFNKYSKANFKFEIIEECDPDFAPALECYWVNLLYSFNRKYGYNLRGVSPFCKLSGKMSKESIEKMKIKRRKTAIEQGYWVSPEATKKRLISRKGYRPSEETKQKMSKAALGRKCGALSDEHKQKISNANKGKLKPPGFIDNLSNLKKKPLIIIDREGNEHYMDSFKSAAIFVLNFLDLTITQKRLAYTISICLRNNKPYKSLVFKGVKYIVE